MIQEKDVFCCDNLELLKSLDDEIIDLIYIDPPFNTGEDFEEFNDIWKNWNEFSNFMKVRLIEMQRVLKSTGSLYLHCDYHANFKLRSLLETIPEPLNLVNEIIWKRSHTKKTSKRFPNSHDTLFLYTKGQNYTFNPQFRELTKSTIKRYNKEDEKGIYMEETLTAPGSTNYWDFGLGEKRPNENRGYRMKKEKMEKQIESGEIFLSSKGNLVKKRYMKDSNGSQVDTLWTDIHHIHSKSKEFNYPTRKPEKLLKRIILTSSNPGDLVADFFCGSGTTLLVAKKLCRRHLGCDINQKAIKITQNRLNKVKNLTNYLYGNDLKNEVI